MTQLCMRLSVFILINGAAASFWLMHNDAVAECERWETDANLAVMPRNSKLDVIFAGSSHGWAFSACRESAAVVDEYFGPATLNLSKKGCGPLPALNYLQAFYARNNRADTLVYIIDPWAIAYRRWNEDAPFLHDEPFEPSFWALAAMNGTSTRQIAAAMRVKFTGRDRPDAERSVWCSRSLDSVDADAAAKRLDYLYPGEFREANMTRYGEVLDEIVETAQAQGTGVLFVVPPTLLGPLPGHGALRDQLGRIEVESGARWFDASNTLTEPYLFRDHDHLNAAGVGRLFKDVVAPAVSESRE